MATRAQLDGRVALVTGGGRGIGRAIARELAALGAAVAIVARSPDQLDAVARELAEAGAEALPLVADLRDAAAPASVVDAVAARFGRLDVLVNNAAVGRFATLEESDVDLWDELLAVNARAPFLLCGACLPYLRRAQPGFVVNVASVAALSGYAGQAAYVASKHALLGLTRALAKEVQADGIRVHAVCPGGTDTTLLRAARPDLAAGEAMQPHEVAELVAFLVTRRGVAVIDQVVLRRATATPWP